MPEENEHANAPSQRATVEHHLAQDYQVLLTQEAQ
jgi:hypothetical protein